MLPVYEDKVWDLQLGMSLPNVLPNGRLTLDSDTKCQEVEFEKIEKLPRLKCSMKSQALSVLDVFTAALSVAASCQRPLSDLHLAIPHLPLHPLYVFANNTLSPTFLCPYYQSSCFRSLKCTYMKLSFNFVALFSKINFITKVLLLLLLHF